MVKRCRARAFSLIELLVVMGILVVLASLLAPAMARSRETARQVTCLSNLKSMGAAMTNYVVNNGGYYPGHCHFGPTAIYAIFPTRLRPYLDGNQNVFFCPDRPDSYRWPVTPAAGTVVTEPAGPQDVIGGYKPGEQLLDVFSSRFSYGWNDWGCGNPQPCPTDGGQRGLGGDIDTNGWGKGTCHERHIRQIMPGTIVITDKTSQMTWDYNIDPCDPSQCPASIHGPGSNVLFADGHAQWMREQALCAFDIKTNQGFAKYSTQWNDVARIWDSDGEP